MYLPGSFHVHSSLYLEYNVSKALAIEMIQRSVKRIFF